MGTTPRRQQGPPGVKRLSGQSWVPLLVTDDGDVVQGSERIVAWAEEHGVPAPAAG